MFSFRSSALSRASSRMFVSVSTKSELCNFQRFAARAFAVGADGYQSGTVKFWLRNKAYGFITPDDPSQADGAAELFVHRTSLDSEHSPEEYPTRPYLVKDERVKFRFQPAAAAGKAATAIDVLFENGRQVPLFRKNYHASVQRGEMKRLGEAVVEILNDGTLSDMEKLEHIKMARGKAEEIIITASQLQAEHGPGERM